MTADTPVLDDELRDLFAPLHAYGVILLAVSGGADSTALMHLIARWRELGLAPADQRVHVATVDHGLRREATAEAEAVGAGAAALGFTHHVLRWTGEAGAGLQERAREGRYQLLEGLLSRLASQRAAVVTAHTANDQAETLVMRLARGSGLDGLASIAPCRTLRQGTPFDLVRPLLRVSKRRLIAGLKAEGIAWSEDPSNARIEFERVRVRAAAEVLEAIGLTSDMLALSAERLSRARVALETVTVAAEGRCVDLNGGAFARLDRQGVLAEPDEVRVRLLARALAQFGGSSPRARLAKVERLAARLASEAAFTVTVGGCVVVADGGQIEIFREPGRRGLPEAVVGPGMAAVWDARFSVSQTVEGERPVIVRALGQRGFAALRDRVLSRG